MATDNNIRKMYKSGLDWLPAEVYDLMQLIEELPASEMQTKIVVKAGEVGGVLGNHIADLTAERDEVLQFLHELSTKGDHIVPSSQCSNLEIAQAQTCKRMYVTLGGLGYVRRTK